MCASLCGCVYVCLCGITLCPRQASVHDQWCMSSLPLSPCPEKSNQGDNLLPLFKKSFQSGEGVLTPTPNPQWSPLSQPCTQPFSLSSPGGSQQSMEDTVHDCSCCRHLKKEVSSPPESSFLKRCYQLTTSWHVFSPPFSYFFFHPGFDHATTRLVGFVRSAFFRVESRRLLHPLAVSFLCCQIKWLHVFVFPVTHDIHRHFPSWKRPAWA